MENRRDNELLDEFKTLIKDIGTDVAEDLSQKVSLEVSEYIIQQQVIKDLNRLHDELSSLNELAPNSILHINASVKESKKILDEVTNNINDCIVKECRNIDNHTEIMNNFRNDVGIFSDTFNKLINDMCDKYCKMISEISDIKQENMKLKQEIMILNNEYKKSNKDISNKMNKILEALTKE